MILCILLLGEIFFQVRGRAFILERESKKLRRFAPNLTRIAGRKVSRFRTGGLQTMRKLIAIISALFLTSVSSAVAGDTTDRVVDSVLGGLGGALIGGPIGLVAGAATGATAGPAISHAWGLEGGGGSSSKKRAGSSARQAGAHKASTNVKARSAPTTEEDI